MSRGTVELDFFAMEKQSSTAPAPRFHKFLHRRRSSFRDIQGAISKIDPEIIKSLITAGAPSLSGDSERHSDSPSRSVSVPSTPREDQPRIPVPPVHAPVVRRSVENVPSTAPMTIFYNGTVSVFEVPCDKAEGILKIASEASSKKIESIEPNLFNSSNQRQKLLQTLDRDLPITRRKSLQRFLEKRKERVSWISPYSV